LILIAFVVFRLKLPKIATETNMPENLMGGNRKSIFSFRNLNFGVWAIFFYVGAEVSIGSYLSNYIADTLYIDVHKSNNFVAFYWGGMLIGRLLGSFVLQKVKPSRVLSVCAIIAILLIITSISTTGYVAVWSMISVGFFNAVMFAIIFSLSANGLGRFTTQASGFLSTSIVGGAIISYLMGTLIDKSTWSIAFILPALCYMYILFYGINGYKSKYSSID